MATTGSWTVYFLIDPTHESPKMAPALDFLDSVPGTVAAELIATIDAVATGPPPSFRGGGRYRTMHGSMTGWHELGRSTASISTRSSAGTTGKLSGFLVQRWYWSRAA